MRMESVKKFNDNVVIEQRRLTAGVSHLPERSGALLPDAIVGPPFFITELKDYC